MVFVCIVSFYFCAPPHFSLVGAESVAQGSSSSRGAELDGATPPWRSELRTTRLGSTKRSCHSVNAAPRGAAKRRPPFSSGGNGVVFLHALVLSRRLAVRRRLRFSVCRDEAGRPASASFSLFISDIHFEHFQTLARSSSASRRSYLKRDEELRMYSFYRLKFCIRNMIVKRRG